MNDGDAFAKAVKEAKGGMLPPPLPTLTISDNFLSVF